MLSLKNELLQGVRTELDTLAKAIVDEVNRYHVQGLGVDGSFTELSGGFVDATDLSSTSVTVTDGTFYIRVTNTTTGEIERYAVDVDASGATPDTPASIAAKIDAVPGLNSSILSSRLHIVADLGYTFDFIPAVLPEPTTTTFTAASPGTVSVSGIYNGDENQVFTFTVVGTGSVGQRQPEARRDRWKRRSRRHLEHRTGVCRGRCSWSFATASRSPSAQGSSTPGITSRSRPWRPPIPRAFWRRPGMNTFFSGASASEMRVCNDIVGAPDRIATAYGGDLTDNTAALRLAAVRDEGVESLTGMTPGEYYHRMVANLGQQVDLRESRQENVEAMIQNLEKRRSDISAVNINDEAAQLMIFEKMFQAMAKYLSTLQTMMATLMDIV